MSTKALRTQLLAAIAMVLVAAIALGSSTYAWFVGQNVVTAEGMQVTAQAEGGIVISNVDDGTDFATTAVRTLAQAAELFPTSTYDLSTWVHAKSSEYDDANAQQTVAASYTNITVLPDQSQDPDDYYLVSQYAIRSAASNVALTGVKLKIDSVTATKSGSNSTNLDKAVRVGIKLSAGGSGSEYYVYAPLAGSDFQLVANYHSGDTLDEPVAPASTDTFALTSNSVPASDTGLIADIYVWFEGEDENCKSSNVTATLDDINISVVFSAPDV